MRQWFLPIAFLWTATAAAAQPAPSQPVAAWEGAAASGAAIDRASGVSLPASIGGFERVDLTALTPDDVAARYRLKQGDRETVATVYLFRAGALPEHRLKGSIQSLGQLAPTAFVWSGGPFDIAASSPLHAYKGVFKTGIGPDTVMDYLYFADLGRWRVKVRATIGSIKDPEEEARVDAFVSALPWSEVLAANGPCSGQACTAPAFERFTSHYGETMLGRLIAMAMKFDEKQEKKLPVATEAEIPLLGKTPIRRSSWGDLTYVATVPRFATYRLIKLPAEASRLFTDAFGRLSITKPVYGLVIGTGKDGFMPRLYHGEPSVEAFGEAVGELVLNETPEPFVRASKYAETIED